MEIVVVRGDIVDQDVDAVVNAANSGLMGGGGVDGAILRAGGDRQLAARKALRDRIGLLPPGRAAASDAGDMTARWVIHVVGPVFDPGEDRSYLLASCYREALRVADELDAKTVAMPAVSAGAYGWPIAPAADIAVATVRAATTSVTEVRFVMVNDTTYDEFERALRS
jgi:O-acetyl-ADP-ribose deacetylase (regulator of RNase III)